MNVIFSERSIAVDMHVYRVIIRLGIADTTSKEEAADIINPVTPDKYKQHAHERLIQHGMKICLFCPETKLRSV